MAEPPPIHKFRTLLDNIPRDDHLQSNYDPHVPVLTIAEPNFNQRETEATMIEGKPEEPQEAEQAELIVPKYPRRPLKIFRAISRSKTEQRPLTEDEIRNIALNCQSPKASRADVAQKIEILIAEIHRLKAQNFGLREQIKNQAPEQAQNQAPEQAQEQTPEQAQEQAPEQTQEQAPEQALEQAQNQAPETEEPPPSSD